MNARLSTHAATRRQQRGISPAMVDLLLRYGTRCYDHRGGCIVHFDKASRERLCRDLGSAAAQLKLSVYAVLDASHRTVITLGHRTRRVQRRS